MKEKRGTEIIGKTANERMSTNITNRLTNFLLRKAFLTLQTLKLVILGSGFQKFQSWENRPYAKMAAFILFFCSYLN